MLGVARLGNFQYGAYGLKKKTRYSTLLALIVCLGAGEGFAGEPAGPASQVLREKLAGHTVVLETAVGEIPIRYHADGSLTGRAPTLQVLRAGPKVDQGRWWVVADKVCQKWRRWLEGSQHCFRVRFVGQAIHWVHDDGRQGTARLLGN